MQIKRFNSRPELHDKALALMEEQMRIASPTPRAIVLPGGRTPFGIYSALAAARPPIDPHLHLILSDERHVAADSPESNHGRMLPLFTRAGFAARQFLHPDTALALDDCAAAYDHRLAEFFERGGRVTLSLLGIGSDGHTASLFDMASLRRAGNEFAIAVRRPDPPDRISVTPRLLRASERVIFLCTGVEKKDIIAQIERNPEEVVAACAVAGVENVELWYSD